MDENTSKSILLTIADYFHLDVITFSIILGILGIIVTIVVAIIIYRRTNRYQRNLKIRNQYRVIWEEASKITPQDIFGIDSYRYDEKIPYYKSEIDKKIEDKIIHDQNILLIGRPISGKTRAIYENLKDKNFEVLIPENSTDFKDAIIPKPRRFKNRRIVILDNLQTLIESKDRSAQIDNGFNNFISNLKNENIQIIASCQSGEELEIVRQKIDTNLIVNSKENILYMPEYGRQEAKEIAEKKLKIEFPEVFDGTIGSLTLPLKTMQNRYLDLDFYAKKILTALKMLYLTGIYNEDGLFTIERTKNLHNRLSSGETTFLNHLDALKKKEFIEGTIKGKMIRARDAYLLYIAETDDKNLIDIFKYMIDNLEDDSEAMHLCGTRAYNLWEVQANQDRIEFLFLSISACEKALKIYTLEDYPQDYAMTQNNLANAYGDLAGIKDTESNLNKAISACEKALKIYTLEDYPQDYAMTQNNLAVAYGNLAGIKDTESNLNKAISAYGEALKVYTEKIYPDRYKSIKSIIEEIKKQQSK